MFFYLAVAGGFAMPPTLGSLSLHHRTGVGGLEGRTLRAGDRLPLALPEPSGPEIVLPEPPRRRKWALPRGAGTAGRSFHRGRHRHLGRTATTPSPSRPTAWGIRLTGPKIEHSAKGYNIVSDGIATGAIQVPGNGLPLILLADRQTTGGYPKIATVISWDLPRLVQCRPGTKVRFAHVERARGGAHRQGSRRGIPRG